MKHRRVWNPLADWDGVALASDGTPIEEVKPALEIDMAAFDILPKRIRDRLNEEGGSGAQWLESFNRLPPNLKACF